MSAPAPILEESARPAPGRTHPGPGSGSPRYYELDVLRFLAAAAVVGFHYFFRAGAQQPVMAHTGFGDPWHVFRYGTLGVQLFFIISGFVILNSSWNKPASAFVASRVARLYPTFWVACTLTAVVLALDPQHRFDVSLHKWLVNLTMMSTMWDVSAIDPVYWTLLLELKFYLLILVLCLVGMTTNRILGFAVGWLALSLYGLIVPLPEWLGALLMPNWSAFFVAGIMFALIARNGWRPRYVAPLIVAFGMCEYLVARFAAGQNDLYDAGLSTPVVLGLVAAMFVVFALIASGRASLPGARWVMVLGALTYPVYLLHQNIALVLFELGYGVVNRWVLLAAALTVVVGLSWTLHVTVERRWSPVLGRWLRARLGALRLGAWSRPRPGAEPLDAAQRRDVPDDHLQPVREHLLVR